MSKKDEGTDDPSFIEEMGTQEYSTQLTRKLNNLRKESSLCDVTIIVGEQRFPAHKAVLSCASDYFQGMFATGFQESSLSEVTVPGTEECFAQLLEFAYTGHFRLSLSTALGILRMACYMMMQDAMKHCATYLQKVTSNLSMDDCFEVCTIATNHDILQDLAKASKNHLAQNFTECGKCPVFLENASIDVMLDMVTDEDIETDECGEEQIIEVVKAWLRYDWEHRKPHTADLLKKLRLGLLPMDTLQKVLGDEILNILDCKTVMEEVQELNATKEEADVPLVQSHPDLFATRNTVTGELSSCEEEGFICKTTSGYYKLEHLNESPITDLPVNQRRSSLLPVNSTVLYIACGYHGQYHPREARRNASLREMNFCKFDVNSNEWAVLEPMGILVDNSDLYLHQFDDNIYAVGSDIEGKYQIQRYNLNSCKWDDYVTVDDPENPMVVYDHAVLGECILFVGDDVCLLYNPSSNTICGVHNNLHVYVYDTIYMSTEVDEAGTCYLRDGRYPEPCHKVDFDFSGDAPSITVQPQEKKNTDDRGKKDLHRPVLTFDK